MHTTISSPFGELVADATLRQIEQAAALLNCDPFALLLAALRPCANDQNVGSDAQALCELA